MADIVINQEYKDQVMSHGDVCAKALSAHTQEELLSLAIQARSSNNPVLLRCFTNLPSLADLRATKIASEVAKIAPEESVATPAGFTPDAPPATKKAKN